MAGMGRKFETGATRDIDQSKLDYEGFLSPVVLQRYAQYMHKNRFREGSTELRASDNWQLGIPIEAYVKSLQRHNMDVWLWHDGRPDLAGEDIETALCAMIFNVQGLLHELLKERAMQQTNPLTDEQREILSGEANPKAEVRGVLRVPTDWVPSWDPIVPTYNPQDNRAYGDQVAATTNLPDSEKAARADQGFGGAYIQNRTMPYDETDQ